MVRHFQGVLPLTEKYENNKCIYRPMVDHIQGVPSVITVNISWQQTFHLLPPPPLKKNLTPISGTKTYFQIFHAIAPQLCNFE